MKEFMDKDFVLETETAKHLFHDYAKDLPIIDYHCHISPQEIYEDRRYENSLNLHKPFPPAASILVRLESVRSVRTPSKILQTRFA